jgi:hypothetical protein
MGRMLANAARASLPLNPGIRSEGDPRNPGIVIENRQKWGRAILAALKHCRISFDEAARTIDPEKPDETSVRRWAHGQENANMAKLALLGRVFMQRLVMEVAAEFRLTAKARTVLEFEEDAEWR